MREELKSYIVQHNLSVELNESVKDILNMYGITEDPEQFKVYVHRKSESPKSSTNSEKGSKNTPVISASNGHGNLKPRSLNTEVGPKASNAGSRVRVSTNKNPIKIAAAKENLKKVKKEKQADCEKENQTSLEDNPSEGSGKLFSFLLEKNAPVLKYILVGYCNIFLSNKLKIYEVMYHLSHWIGTVASMYSSLSWWLASF